MGRFLYVFHFGRLGFPGSTPSLSFFRPTAFTSPHTAFGHAAGVPIRSSMWETIVALRTKRMGLTFSPASHRGSRDRGLKRRAQWVLYLRLSRPPVPSFVPFFPYLFFFFFCKWSQ